MKKILVILTGGTIGSMVKSNLINVNSASAYSLIDFYNKAYNSDTAFEVIQPLNVLSENFTPSRWTILCRTLSNIDYTNYSGVIITHGSDTFAYTSALIGMLFHHVQVPIVLIASNYALGEPNSNGLDNFRSAVSLIKQNYINGVFSIFQNSNGDNDVYISTRIMEADSYNDQFRSFGGNVFGKISNGKLEVYDSFINPDIMCINSSNKKICNTDICFDNNVLVIRPYPGLDYNSINLDSKPKAILHYLYHSSTACTEGDNYSILEFIKKCNKQNIDFYVAPFKDTDSKMYVTSEKFLNLGVIPLTNISVETAYIKLLILYNQAEIDKKTFINSNIYFESLPQK